MLLQNRKTDFNLGSGSRKHLKRQKLIDCTNYKSALTTRKQGGICRLLWKPVIKQSQCKLQQAFLV